MVCIIMLKKYKEREDKDRDKRERETWNDSNC